MSYIITKLNTDQELNPKDISLLSGSFSTSYFIPYKDFIQVTIYDANGNVNISDPYFNLFSVQSTKISSSNQFSELILDFDTINNFYGYNRGQVTYRFDFNRPLFTSTPTNRFFIAEISPSRTEIRLDGDLLTSGPAYQEVLDYSNKITVSSKVENFYLDFGDGVYCSAINILPNNGTVLVKLYEPLPDLIEEKDQCYVYERLSEPVFYEVVFDNVIETVNPKLFIKGPNTNIDLRRQDAVNETYQTLSSLLSTNQTGSTYQLNSILQEKGVDINVDYSKFENYIHYSSAKQRLVNFYYKVSQIENYNSNINQLSIITGSTSSSISVSASKATYQAKINSIIQNFDGFEYYMYFESSSLAWPKSTSVKPYALYSTGSNEVLTWLGSDNDTSAYYGGRLLSASIYDDWNKDNILNAVPQHLRDNPANAPYELFVNMIGQHFDVLWLYTNNITKVNDADNRIDYGAPKQLLGDILRSFGLKIYENGFTDDIYTTFLGITNQGLLTLPTGSDKIDTYVTSSGDILMEDYKYEIYKRLYNNLPYLIKKKGSIQGLKNLISIYGVPDTVLEVNELGGKDTLEVNDWDRYTNVYNYAYRLDDTVTGNTRVETRWAKVNSSFNRTQGQYPSTIMWRMKFDKPNSGSFISPTTASLLHQQGDKFGVLVEYTQSLNNLAYSGSYTNTSESFANVILVVSSSSGNRSSSMTVPVYDNNWWSFKLDQVYGNPYKYHLSAQNKIYNGIDGTKLGYYASCSVESDIYWANSASATDGRVEFPMADITSSWTAGRTIVKPTASYQEIRYYSQIPTRNVFDQFTMNPYSMEGNEVEGSECAKNILTFRAPLGTDLNIYREDSIHPAVTGSIPTGSDVTAAPNDSKYFFVGTQNYVSGNVETIFLNQPNLGSTGIVNDKVQIVNPDLVEGNTLSRYVAIQGTSSLSTYYGPSQNIVEVTMSPQNIINADILNELGYFEIGEYIGDQRQRFSSSYSDLKRIRDNYFSKYEKNYSYVDYFRLLKYFDNSLFKLIKDFTPLKSKAITGLQIKPTLLERDKYKQPTVTHRRSRNFSASISMYGIQAGAAGVVTQSTAYSSSIITPSGSTLVLISDERSQYNGVLGGSTVEVTDGNLNGINAILKVNDTQLVYNITVYTGSIPAYPTAGQLFVRVQDVQDGAGWLSAINAYRISNTDLNGVYVKDALANLSPGDRISFKLNTNVVNQTAEVNKEIINLSQNNTGYSVLTKLHTYDTASIGVPQSTSNVKVILDPFLQIPSYGNYDYLVAKNNVTELRTSSLIYEVEYTNGITNLPSNFNAIYSSSALGASVQDSNYSRLSVILPRYLGSKNTADSFYSTGAFAPVKKSNTVILESDYGGGTYPLLLDCVSFPINAMMLVQEKDEVSYIPTYQNISFVREHLRRHYSAGTNVRYVQYLKDNVNYEVPAELTVAFADIKVPADAAYICPCTTDKIYVDGDSTVLPGSSNVAANFNGYIELNADLWEVARTSEGYFCTSSKTQTSSSIYLHLSSSLAEQNRWFVTTYEHLYNIVSGSLTPGVYPTPAYQATASIYNPYDQLTSTQQRLFDLGVNEIIGVTQNSNKVQLQLTTELYPSVSYVIGESQTHSTARGIIIWNGSLDKNTEYLTFQFKKTEPIGRGGFITSQSSDVIKTNFNYITETYGSN